MGAVSIWEEIEERRGQLADQQRDRLPFVGRGNNGVPPSGFLEEWLVRAAHPEWCSGQEYISHRRPPNVPAIKRRNERAQAEARVKRVRDARHIADLKRRYYF